MDVSSPDSFFSSNGKIFENSIMTPAKGDLPTNRQFKLVKPDSSPCGRNGQRCEICEVLGLIRRLNSAAFGQVIDEVAQQSTEFARQTLARDGGGGKVMPQAASISVLHQARGRKYTWLQSFPRPLTNPGEPRLVAKS
jgi:hypothetical protein